tara:strand:+ start:399 stop:1157 length:759 start_codon:yes stop_codon:yes gene_type:complete
VNHIILTYKIIFSQLKKQINNNIISLISGFLIVLLIRSILAIMDTIFIPQEFPFQRIVFILTTALLIMGMEIGYTKFVFHIIDKKNKGVNSIFNYFHYLIHYLKGLCLYYFLLFLLFLPLFIFLFFNYEFEFFEMLFNSINDPYFYELVANYFNFQAIIMVFLLCFLPSIYIAIRLSFWSYFVIDKELSALKSLKQSWFITNTRSLEICFFALGLLLFNLLGAMILIGICFTVPISYLFFCLYFRHLIANQR